MSIQHSVAALKQRFENLFPGKWVNGDAKSSVLLTRIPAIDHGLTRGIARQRITEWCGPPSSGKSSILRALISNWCASGFNVAYVDSEDKLVASDWIFIEQGKCGAKPVVSTKIDHKTQAPGKFWVIHHLSETHNDPLPPIASFNNRSNKNINASRQEPHSLENGSAGAHGAPLPYSTKRYKDPPSRRNGLWAADELIRSNAFDVVVLDLGASEKSRPVQSRVYARLQNSLARSKAAFILLRDSDVLSPGWGSYAQLDFRWGTTVNCTEGLHGTAMITPSINCSVLKDGQSQTTEVQISSHVSNCLFTHPHVPDRRTPKT
jgi:RecA/RadA recombinase